MVLKLSKEQKRKSDVMKRFLGGVPNKPDDVKCKKHGKTPSMSYKVHDIEKIKVCFLCYAEKQTEGLTNFVK